MDRKGRSVRKGSLRFLLIAACASFAVVSPLMAVESATTAQGRLSGVVSLARASVPIHNLVLQPDGSFSGRTRAVVTGSRLARAYSVNGRFSGDNVSLTLEDNI
jgi:hypothetical protein